MNKFNLLNYAVGYLSKYSSSKKNLERILKNKIVRLTKNKKERFELYNQINEIVIKLEKNNLINDKIFVESKINLFFSQGKSKRFIENYLTQKGIEKEIIEKNFFEFNNNNNEWEIQSALIFAKKKKLLYDNEDIKKRLAKMARAGFSYEICKKVLKIN
jgi:regulatory protein|tara:strand:+ start:3324 stop:3800 length:477 start_codon:yes stop_codon:yes gene_type:complete